MFSCKFMLFSILIKNGLSTPPLLLQTPTAVLVDRLRAACCLDDGGGKET